MRINDTLIESTLVALNQQQTGTIGLYPLCDEFTYIGYVVLCLSFRTEPRQDELDGVIECATGNFG